MIEEKPSYFYVGFFIMIAYYLSQIYKYITLVQLLKIRNIGDSND